MNDQKELAVNEITTFLWLIILLVILGFIGMVFAYKQVKKN